MTTATGKALDTVAADQGIIGLVAQPVYRAEFADTLPAHISADTFVRLAQGALRRNADLRKAAQNDPGAFIYAIREAARLGHEPGSKNFWLVPIGGKVEGWEGYEGIVERMYRAGAALSVVAELVYSGDVFDWRPGAMDRPQHAPDWFGGNRGDIIGAYSYALMRGGAVSKVVVIDQTYIAKVKAESKGSGRADSPWQKWPESMILKTALRRLEPFVPTSAEYLREQLRTAATVAAETPPVFVPQPPAPAHVDSATGEVVDGELVPDPHDGQDPWATT